MCVKTNGKIEYRKETLKMVQQKKLCSKKVKFKRPLLINGNFEYPKIIHNAGQSMQLVKTGGTDILHYLACF